MDGSKKKNLDLIEEMRAFEAMQERLRQRGQETMLLKPWTRSEIEQLKSKLDANYEANETRLEIATRKREDKRKKKQDRREVAPGTCCLIVPDERRGDRRGKWYL